MFSKSANHDVFDKAVEHEDEDDAELPADTEPEAAATSLDAGATDDVVADEEPVSTPEVRSDDAAPPPSPTGRRFRGVVVGVAVALFAAAIALAGFLGWQLKQDRDTAAAARTALDVSRTYAVTLTSVDNGKIDENFAQVLDGATGGFKDMYSQSAAQLRQLLIDNKAVSHGTVVDAGIKSASEDRVEVLIFVDQSISNSVNPRPRIDRSRVTMTMERIDDRWLASKVDIQ